jgi:hypothetical protein
VLVGCISNDKELVFVNEFEPCKLFKNVGGGPNKRSHHERDKALHL